MARSCWLNSWQGIPGKRATAVRLQEASFRMPQQRRPQLQLPQLRAAGHMLHMLHMPHMVEMG